jgi:type IV secretory pathway VirB10-like protein
LNGTICLLLPLDERSRGRRRFFFFCHHHLSLQKHADTTCPKLSSCWRRGRRCVPRAIFGAVAQWPPQPRPSPVFAYKNRGGEEKKSTREQRGSRDQKKRAEDQKKTRKGKKAVKKEKQRRREGRQRRRRERREDKERVNRPKERKKKIRVEESREKQRKQGRGCHRRHHHRR